MPARLCPPVATIAECLELLADGETLVRTADGRWLLAGIVDLRLAREAAEGAALALIENGYVAALPKRAFRGSVAEYDITPAGEAAAARLKDEQGRCG